MAEIIGCVIVASKEGIKYGLFQSRGFFLGLHGRESMTNQKGNKMKKLVQVQEIDGEGNGFSPLADFSLNMYEADSTWSGELKDKEEMEDGEFKINSVILWPTN